MKKTPKSILKEVFGYNDFRENQLDIINSTLNKEDAMVVMPTGSGKSLCYQIPSLIFEGLTVVVSPLISLMKDQVLKTRWLLLLKTIQVQNIQKSLEKVIKYSSKFLNWFMKLNQ